MFGVFRLARCMPFQVLTKNTVVIRIIPRPPNERFVVCNNLNPAIYDQSITVKFAIIAGKALQMFANGRPLSERGPN